MKRILAHLDDVGATRGSVEAWKALRKAGVVRSASMMVPCPWYPAARDDFRENPDQDMGVHLTLNSEWSTYRWRPISGAYPGLTDADGFFYPRPEIAMNKLDPSAVQDEIFAQIERAIADGLKPTHLDAHMGCAFLEPFIGATLAASDHFAIPILLCRELSVLFHWQGHDLIDLGYFAELIAEFERRGAPVMDNFLIDFCPDTLPADAHYETMIKNAPDGTHFLALHANAPDDMQSFAPHQALARQKEFDLFSDPNSIKIFGPADVITFADL